MSWRLNKWDDKNKVRRMRNVEGKEWLQLKCNSPWRGWGSSLSDFWKELPVERTTNANNLRQKYAFCAQSGDQSGWRRERESLIEKGGGEEEERGSSWDCEEFGWDGGDTGSLKQRNTVIQCLFYTPTVKIGSGRQECVGRRANESRWVFAKPCPNAVNLA